MPVTSTLLDQAHNAIERKLFAMKGFHHPGGSQQAFLTGLAHLYNLVPYQRRAQHAGHCGVEVEGGTVPTRDAQFIAVCSSAKTYEIGKNLLVVSDQISRPQGRLIPAGALVRTSTLQRVVYLSPADKYPRLTRPTVTGAKRHSQEGSHGLPAVLCPLVTPSKPAVRTHVACAGPLPSLLPTTRLAHTPAGCGHGGTRKSSISRSVQTWSVNPAAIAGVCGRHCLADPVPFVGLGSGKG
jgi:hypothetical protein